MDITCNHLHISEADFARLVETFIATQGCIVDDAGLKVFIRFNQQRALKIIEVGLKELVAEGHEDNPSYALKIGDRS